MFLTPSSISSLFKNSLSYLLFSGFLSATVVRLYMHLYHFVPHFTFFLTTGPVPNHGQNLFNDPLILIQHGLFINSAKEKEGSKRDCH